MKIVVAALLLLVPSVAARGDILEWRDQHGVRHYTNLREEIPAAHRDAAQVVIDEKVRRAPEPPPAPAREQTSEPQRQAQVVYDRAVIADAYRDGLERGLELARGLSGPAYGGSVQIQGPLAIAGAAAPPPVVVYPLPYSYPWVSSSFDRGRSRHLTLRLLMQDQFLLDREGPYAFAVNDPPPLVPYLPRGVPCRGACQKRGLVR